MLRRLFALVPMIAFPISCSAADYHYAIRDGGFAIHDGPAYFNRPLFGTHEPTMLLSGDRPAFAYFSPADLGKIGTLYLGLVTANGGKWLHQFAEVAAVYQPGLTRHVVADPMLQGGSLDVTAVPLSTAEGFTLQLRWLKPPLEKVRLIWFFGGASGYRTNYSARIEKLHASAADSAQNVIRVWGSRFSLTSPTMKGKEILGTCDLAGRLELKDAEQARAGPAQAESAAPSATPVVVFGGDWPRTQDAVHLLFTLGGVPTLEDLARRPAETFAEGVKFYRSLARRVEVKTPDPHFDLAVEAMVIANDGLWQPPAFLHGAMSWMQHYLGWRGWYGSEALGFHDRVRSAILAFASLQFQGGENRGALPHTLTSKSVFYNMNEVFLDHVYYHYLWTGDREMLGGLFPVIDGILTWEKRRLDPDGNALYESCLNTWISDSHWYSGGDTTQASAYMYRGNQLAAAAAEAAGKDPTPFHREASRIRRAMNDKLWLPSQGHYAEFIDRMGLKRVHTEPELPTIYHPIDFGVTDQLQAYQMLRFTETNLRNETGMPGGGRLVWSSNWAPNFNRQYTHSTHDLVFAEALNLAIAYYRAGQFDKAYELVKGTYAAMYQGGIPGGLSCHAYRNGQQRANEEFADSISMFARVVVEGVFGILPQMQSGIIHLTPGFPVHWKEASIVTPDISYRFHKTDSEITIEATSARPVRIHYRFPLGQARLLAASIDGATAHARIEPGIGGAFLDAMGSRGNRSVLRIRLNPREVVVRSRPVVAVGDELAIHIEGAPAVALKDPQGVLAQPRLTEQNVAGTVRAPLGHHTLFVSVGGAEASWWEPIRFEVRPPVEIVNSQPDFISGACRFALRNNTASELKAKAKVAWAGGTTALPVSLASQMEQQFKVEGSAEELLPGKNRLEITGLSNLGAISTEVNYWPEGAPARTVGRWETLRLDSQYNDSFSTILFRPYWTSEYPYAVCCDYMLAHLNGPRNRVPDDGRLRAQVNTQGVFMTHYGIPFAQRAKGNNMVALGRWKELPDRIEIPVNDVARRICLLLSGMTFPMQSHIANARVTVHYADGQTSVLDLTNPKNFDNGWGKFGGTYHYAANGIEIIGEKQPENMEAVHAIGSPGVILRQQGTPEPFVQPEWDVVPPPPHADIVDVVCDPGRKIRHVDVEVLSNEIIVGLLGVTLLH
jgi:hypothetical protein